MRDVLPRFERGAAVIGVCGKSFKCPPAPSETALLLHDYLTARGRRAATEISVVMPFGTPIPPSPDTSKAILAAFAAILTGWWFKFVLVTRAALNQGFALPQLPVRGTR